MKQLKDAPPEIQKRFETLRHIKLIDLAKELEQSGSEGSARINRWIISNLEWCRQSDMPPSQCLIDAVAHQLDVRAPHERHPKMVDVVADLVHDPSLSNKKLAKRHGVSLPTIASWRLRTRRNQRVPWTDSELLKIAKDNPRLINNKAMLADWLDLSRQWDDPKGAFSFLALFGSEPIR